MFVSAQVQWLFLNSCFARNGDDRALERKGDALYMRAISIIQDKTILPHYDAELSLGVENNQH